MLILINKETLDHISEYEFRQLNPNIFYPVIITDESIIDSGYALLYSDIAKPTPSLYQKLVSASAQVIAGKYQEIWIVEDMTSDEILAVDARIQRDIINTTQCRLDAFAQSRGYDGIMSACTYSDSSIPAFSTEGKYAVVARDTTWAALYTLLAEVEAGVKPKPTGYADVEAILPILTWPV